MMIMPQMISIFFSYRKIQNKLPPEKEFIELFEYACGVIAPTIEILEYFGTTLHKIKLEDSNEIAVFFLLLLFHIIDMMRCKNDIPILANSILICRRLCIVSQMSRQISVFNHTINCRL